MKKTTKKTKAETVIQPKPISLDAIQDAADKAGMTASELLEWGLYSVMETFDGENSQISDVKNELKRGRTLKGGVPAQFLPSDPLAKFAADAGLNFDELNELALMSAIDILDNSIFPDKQPRELLEDNRLAHGPLIPSFLHDRVAAHPFMAQLFSGAYTPPNKFQDSHIFIGLQLERIFDEKQSAESMACEVRCLYEAIKHHPELQREAAAMKAFFESQDILQRFVFKMP